MPSLAVISTNPGLAGAGAMHESFAHDVRNLLATVGLHLESLRRLSGPSGAKAADAAHALLARGSSLCNGIMDRMVSVDGRARRRGVDLMQVARQVADLLAPAAPARFSFDIGQSGTASVLADPDEAFRILYNLMNNAVAVANRDGTSLGTVTIRTVTEGSMLVLQIADDGPGLPIDVRTKLFRRRATQANGQSRHGHGVAIARELAEQNGGTLTLVPSEKGTTFALKLPIMLSVLIHREPMGRRAMMV